MDPEIKPAWDDESREKFFNQMRSKVSDLDNQLEEFDQVYKDKKQEVYQQLFEKMKPKELNKSEWQTLINFATAKRKRAKTQKAKEASEKLDTKRKALVEAKKTTTNLEELALMEFEIEREQARFDSMLKEFGNGDIELGKKLWESTVLGITD